ncbi:MAG: S-layer homology domain-containing protein [Candidatus Absconditabacterales bacterium]|nr:S-layer homology domain-containing protein [Candidatus Absconditabacterales bacterium]
MKLYFKKSVFITITFSLLSTAILGSTYGEETLYYGEDNIFGNNDLQGIEHNKSDIWFKYGGNNFGGLFFITNIKTLAHPETIKLGNETIMCNKQINGLYYNNQRGMRFWPLDHSTLNILKDISGDYEDIEINGGFFTDCKNENKNQIYGNITHIIQGYQYELIAGVELNFGWNTYLGFGLSLNLPKLGQSLKVFQEDDGIFLSGYIFDNYGGIGLVLGSGNEICVSTRQVDPSKICSGDSFVQYDNCGNTKIEYGTKDCNSVDHLSPGIFCKYDDERYLNKGAFIDTKDHRGFEYIEIMRKSCLHRGKGTLQGQWIYYPNDYIKKSEVLKTLVKVRGIAFDDFYIESEDKFYPFDKIFEDVAQNNWFVWYTNYAFTHGLTDGLYNVQNNKKYLNPESYLNRYESVKKIIETYNEINGGSIKLNSKTNLIDIDISNPYYSYIRQAESLGIIEGFKQKDGTYKFEGDRFITRAEFAKIVSIPFMLLLIGYE